MGPKQLIFLFLLKLIRENNAVLHTGGYLYPYATETRQVMSLDGIWDFVLANRSAPLQGFSDEWFRRDLNDLNDAYQVHKMPVPSSYNDITTFAEIRDHVGLVWYSRNFFVPSTFDLGRVWIRFGSVSYAAQIWINGNLVAAHEIGHLPIFAEITDNLRFGSSNLITVACDNTLLANTIPQGSVSELNSGRLVQNYGFDFFNYAGIDRSVIIYTTPRDYIDDISVWTGVTNTTGYVEYRIKSVSHDENVDLSLAVQLVDKLGNAVAAAENESSGAFEIPNATLWWPYLMHSQPGYRYKFVVDLVNSDGLIVDRYSMPIGIRSLQWTNTTFLINDQPIYFHGFGRHEDSDIRGKGFDWALVARDHNLIKWIGANVYRTSHYPYAEEIMDFAEEIGIMIIDECPSVNTDYFTDDLLANHNRSLTELIRRDKNRANVVMWSAANEPVTKSEASGNYFKRVVEHIKSLDKTRPVTVVVTQPSSVDESSQYVDIVSFNRYNAWYTQAGSLDVVKKSVVDEAIDWNRRFDKPVIMMEYGADTIEGLHFLPEFIWSEEYQVKLMSQHFEAFDELRAKGWFIGEFIWNFADFKTAQSYTRVAGNKKGVFTRNRQPKSSAHHLRRRYWALAQELYNASQPNDLTDYISAGLVRDEL